MKKQNSLSEIEKLESMLKEDTCYFADKKLRQFMKSFGSVCSNVQKGKIDTKDVEEIISKTLVEIKLIAENKHLNKIKNNKVDVMSKALQAIVVIIDEKIVELTEEKLKNIAEFLDYVMDELSKTEISTNPVFIALTLIAKSILLLEDVVEFPDINLSELISDCIKIIDTSITRIDITESIANNLVSFFALLYPEQQQLFSDGNIALIKSLKSTAPPTVSETQRAIYDCLVSKVAESDLSQDDLHFGMEKYVDEVGHPCDIVFKITSKHDMMHSQVIVEYDGITHMNSSGRYNLTTLRQTNAAISHGIFITRIDYRIFEKTKFENAIEQVCDNIIENIHRITHGELVYADSPIRVSSTNRCGTPTKLLLDGEEMVMDSDSEFAVLNPTEYDSIKVCGMCDISPLIQDAGQSLFVTAF